jgi:tRNA threonylcarbamoyl adenosine modification protein YeaZ
MLVLALDTATPACSVAVVDVQPGPAAGDPALEVLAAASAVDARRHGELLAPSIAEVTARAGIALTDLAAVVAGIGPGPFTSLRVGVVTASALADALGVGVHGVCSLDGIAAGRPGRVAAVTDARRREVFWAVYDEGGRIAGPEVNRPDEALAAMSELGVTEIVGEGVEIYPAVFPAQLSAVDKTRAGAPAGTAAGGRAYPDPAQLARLAAPAILAGHRPPPPTPLYLRRPDATPPRPPAAAGAGGGAARS